MDWTAANAAMKAVRGYQEAFKQGRMDIVKQQSDLYEQAMRTLSAGTGIQQMRQGMEIAGKQQQMAEELFPYKKELAAEEPEYRRAQTAGLGATTEATEQETAMRKRQGEERGAAMKIVSEYLASQGYNMTNPVAIALASDAVTKGENMADIKARADANLSEYKAQTEKAKLGAEKATAKTTIREEGIRGEISPETIKDAMEGGLKAEAMKPDIEQKKMDLSSAYIRQIDNAISMDEYYKISKKNEMEANALYASAKAKELENKEEQDKMEEYKARQILQKSLEDAGIETERARLKAITIELPDKLKQNIKDAEKQKQLASENDQAGLRGSLQILKTRGAIAKDATVQAIDKTLIIEAMDTLIAEWKSDLLLWGSEYEYGEARIKEKAKEASIGEGSPELNKQLDSFNW